MSSEQQHKRQIKDLKSQTVLIHFQCGVYRGLYRSRLLKQPINPLNQEHDLYHVEMMNASQEDNTKLQSANERLKKQSIAHQQRAESLQNEKNRLKSQVVELLEAHAPNDQIKRILTDKHTYGGPTVALPSHGHEPVETRINSHILSHEMLQIADAKNEIHNMRSEIRSTTTDLYQQTYSDITHLTQRYDAMLKSKNDVIAMLKDVLVKVNHAHHTDITSYKEQMEHKNEEINALKTNTNFLSLQISAISEHNQTKIQNMNETHEKELNEINALLNQLSNQFDSLKSSAANSPHKHTEGMTTPSLSDKVQCIKRKLHSRFRKQKEKHQLQINGLNYKMNGMKQSISELNVRMESKRDEVETYKSLLCQIRPYQEQYHKLQVSYQQVLDESHQIKEQCRDELNAASLTYQVTLDCRNEEIETLTQRVGEMQERRIES
eukprot:163262_1